MLNQVCMICRDKNSRAELDVLRRLEQEVSHGVVVTEGVREAGRGIAFLWDIHARCRYGLTCNELLMYKNRCRQLAMDLEDRLVAVAIGNNIGKYASVMNMLRGNFPAAYRTLERIHQKECKKKEKKDE